MLHLLFDGLVWLVVIAGEGHLREEDEIRAFLRCCLNVSFDAVQVDCLVSPDWAKRHRRNSDYVFVHTPRSFP